MIMIYVIDVILLIVLFLLIILLCCYGTFCIYRVVTSIQRPLLLRPARVVFSHKKEEGANAELRTVVAYQNPFTGDYCVHKSRGAGGYENALQSPDSGLSDEYEPLRPAPAHVPKLLPELSPLPSPHWSNETDLVKPPMTPVYADNSLNKTWNWNYKEYQI